jgi:hypothetical protein
MPGRKLLEKRLRMVLDFEVEVEELTDESLREYYRRMGNFEEIVGDAELWANISRQIRLQRVLLADEQVLNKYLTYVAAVEVDGSTDSELAGVFGVGGDTPEEDIFEPLFSKLSQDDEMFYRQVSEEKILYDQIEPLSRSFKAKWIGATFEEIKRVAEGSFDNSSE